MKLISYLPQVRWKIGSQIKASSRRSRLTLSPCLLQSAERHLGGRNHKIGQHVSALSRTFHIANIRFDGHPERASAQQHCANQGHGNCDSLRGMRVPFRCGWNKTVPVSIPWDLGIRENTRPFGFLLGFPMGLLARNTGCRMRREQSDEALRQSESRAQL